MLRTAGIIIPVYIILVAVTKLLNRRPRQWQVRRNPSLAKHFKTIRMQFEVKLKRDDVGCSGAGFRTYSGGESATAATTNTAARHQHPVTKMRFGVSEDAICIRKREKHGCLCAFIRFKNQNTSVHRSAKQQR
jgi:hypothetical protein